MSEERVFPTKGRRRRSVSAMTALVATVLVAAAISFGAAVALVAGNSSSDRENVHRIIDQTRAEQCIVVDGDHNRERAQVVQTASSILPTARNGLDFAGKHYTVAELYKNFKRNYEAPRRTRPPYCDKYHKNPVKPFPSLHEFQAGKAP